MTGKHARSQPGDYGRQDQFELNRSQPRQRLNVYTCPRGHETVTIDRDEGTTPFMIVCNQGGHDCTETARSAFYRVPPGLTPSHEWYKPTLRKARRMDRKVPGTLDHVTRGGLLLRPIRLSLMNSHAADTLTARLLRYDRQHLIQQAGYRLAFELAALDRALVEQDLSLAADVLDFEDFCAALGLDPRLALTGLAFQRWVELCQLRKTFSPEMLDRLTAYAHHKLSKPRNA